MEYPINNLDKIESVDLVENIKSLYRSIIYRIANSHKYNTNTHIDLVSIIIHSVQGTGVPICISDGYIFSPNSYPPRPSNYVKNNHSGHDYECYLTLTYEVTWLYKPYQKIDEPINLNFLITPNMIRDFKLESILDD